VLDLCRTEPTTLVLWCVQEVEVNTNLTVDSSESIQSHL